jgi:hypothetical protein
MELEEFRERLQAARMIEARRKRASDGRLRREIREAFAGQGAREPPGERPIRVQPDRIRPVDRER